jgi:hypothetical protein
VRSSIADKLAPQTAKIVSKADGPPATPDAPATPQRVGQENVPPAAPKLVARKLKGPEAEVTPSKAITDLAVPKVTKATKNKRSRQGQVAGTAAVPAPRALPRGAFGAAKYSQVKVQKVNEWAVGWEKACYCRSSTGSGRRPGRGADIPGSGQGEEHNNEDLPRQIRGGRFVRFDRPVFVAWGEQQGSCTETEHRHAGNVDQTIRGGDGSHHQVGRLSRRWTARESNLWLTPDIRARAKASAKHAELLSPEDIEDREWIGTFRGLSALEARKTKAEQGSRDSEHARSVGIEEDVAEAPRGASGGREVMSRSLDTGVYMYTHTA